MAVSRQQAMHDLYGEVRLREHDERVETGDWVYYVRGVRTRGELTGTAARWAGLGDVGLVAVLVLGLRHLARRDRWAVGVVRLAPVSSHRLVTPDVVRYEVLPRGQYPRARIAELVALLESGDFEQSDP